MTYQNKLYLLFPTHIYDISNDGQLVMKKAGRPLTELLSRETLETWEAATRLIAAYNPQKITMQ